MEVVDYSEAAIAVYGDSTIIAEKLKALGCRWNPNLRDGKGWICSKRKEKEVREIVLNAPSTTVKVPSNAVKVPSSTVRTQRVKMPQETLIDAREFEKFTDFEVINLSRDDFTNIYKTKLNALQILGSQNKLEAKLKRAIHHQAFKGYYLMDDRSIVDELDKEHIPYIQGLNHLSAAIICAYIFDDTFPEDGLEIVKQFVPTFDIKAYLDI